MAPAGKLNRVTFIEFIYRFSAYNYHDPLNIISSIHVVLLELLFVICGYFSLA